MFAMPIENQMRVPCKRRTVKQWRWLGPGMDVLTLRGESQRVRGARGVDSSKYSRRVAGPATVAMGAALSGDTNQTMPPILVHYTVERSVTAFSQI